MFTGAILGITLLCNTKALAYDGNYNPVSVKMSRHMKKQQMFNVITQE